MRIDDAGTRWSAPRLIGTAAVLLGLFAVVLLGHSGGAAAAPGPTDLSITKSDSPDPVSQGSNLTYTIRVTNTGANDATNVVVTDNLPSTSDVDFVSATSPAGTCQRSGGTVTCDLGTVLSGATQTVTIVVKAKKTGTLSNTASVASPDDTNSANNSATAATSVVKATTGKGKKGRPSCAAPTIRGTTADDVITGSDRADVIVTFEGNDQVFALGGKDLVCTGAGFDVVIGGFGGDTIIAGSDADRVIGNSGGDLLKGKAGRDRLKGKSGNDILNGGSSRDKCKGGKGSDVLKRCP